MAYLFRLILWAVVASLALCVLPAAAQTGFATQEEADAFSANVMATSPHCTAGKYCDRLLDIPGDQPMYAGRYFVRSWSSGGTFIQAFSYYFSELAQSCDERNDDPATAPGSGLYLDSQVDSKCVAGCVLDIVGDPLEVVQGRVAGQPANFYRFAREYTGETCEGDSPPDESEFTPTEDGPECNFDAGVCVTPDGDTEYCTFNPDGSPSTCIPAVDYDNDGIADDDDSDPGTPQDGEDDGSGDETDNSASGGASCSTAPSCTGDGIACMTLYQQWKTRCAVENLKITVTLPGVSNEFQEIQAGDLGDASDYGDAGVTADQAWRPEGEGGSGESPIFDDSGWLSSRACPVIPVVNTAIMGTAISIDFNNEDLCWFLSLGAQLVLVFAALQSIRIYSRVI